uniref:Uncharacterized protein n=1 Tax=Aliivibrio fischeri TaxID=668 RepID=H2ES60_ALIFS|nr:hypothetical protein [Aliivibrio fischeri]
MTVLMAKEPVIWTITVSLKKQADLSPKGAASVKIQIGMNITWL